jgi:hypothetical protein
MKRFILKCTCNENINGFDFIILTLSDEDIVQIKKTYHKIRDHFDGIFVAASFPDKDFNVYVLDSNTPSEIKEFMSSDKDYMELTVDTSLLRKSESVNGIGLDGPVLGLTKDGVSCWTITKYGEEITVSSRGIIDINKII